MDSTPLELIIFSAKNALQLTALLQKMKVFLLKNKQLSIEDIAYTLQIGRSSFSERIAILAKTPEDLLSRIMESLEHQLELNSQFIFKKDQFEPVLFNQETINVAILKNDMQELAKIWVSGADISWQYIDRSNTIKKIELPGYAFSDAEYWLPEMVDCDIASSIERAEIKDNNHKKKRICVIGGGPSGLVMAKSLLEEGHVPIVFEVKAHLGGVWNPAPNKFSGVYKKTRFQNSKDTSFFSDFYPKETPELFLSANQVLDYLYQYSDHFKLLPHIQFNSKVLSVRQADNQQWCVVVKQNNQETQMFFDGVALCHGRYATPWYPDIKTLSQFKGEVLHSGQYVDNSIFKGKRILVIGNGVSGMDIAEDATETAVQVFWSMRSLKLVLPRMVGFLPNDFVSPARLLVPDNIEQIMSRLKHSDPEYYKSYQDSGLFPSLQEVMKYPFIHVNDNVMKLVSQGRITAMVDTIESFSEKDCHYANDCIRDIDMVVFCTGYQNEKDFEYIKDITIENDFMMGLFYYKNPTMVNTYGLNDIGTTGTFPYLEMVARWYAQIISGKYQLSAQEIASRVNPKDIVVAPLSNVVMALKLGFLPNPMRQFKEFWALFTSPSFPVMFRLYGACPNHSLTSIMAMSTQRSLIQNEQNDPALLKIKYRILGGFEQSHLDDLLKRYEITIEDYTAALAVGSERIVLDWGLQFMSCDAQLKLVDTVQLCSQKSDIDDVQNQLLDMMSSTIKLSKKAIDPNDNLSSYGLNSITLTAFATRIMTAFPQVHFEPVTFIEYPTLKKLADYLCKLLVTDPTETNENRETYRNHTTVRPSHGHDDEKPKNSSSTKSSMVGEVDGIAIIGIGGKFPGAESVAEFWINLLEDKTTISEIPAGRWDWRIHHGNPDEDNKTDCNKGSFIENVKSFDAEHFGVALEDAGFIDPQHRLLLEVVWQGLENAGYTKDYLYEKSIGLFVGVERQDYYDSIKASGHPIAGHINTGNSHSMLVNRVSHFFGWKGPSMAVNAACCSSFVALQAAINSIHCGQVEMVVAGGVNLLLSPDLFIYNRKLGLFTGEDVVKPFSKHATGHLFSEGLAVVVLKKYSDALRDRDNIYGVIKGISVRHGGQGVFLTAPNLQSHKNVIHEALTQAGFSPNDINYVEAQGTANELSDIVELKTYHDVFSVKRPGALPIGTVTGHTGHFAGASGIVALIKAVLSLKNDQLIKVRNFDQLSWSPEDGTLSCEIVKANMHWPKLFQNGNQISRKLGVHNFGFGGNTGHLILEEHCEPVSVQENNSDHVIIVLSSGSVAQLKSAANRLINYIKKEEYKYYGLAALDLLDMSYTLQVGRQAMDYRLVFLVRSVAELMDKLLGFCNGELDKTGCYQSHRTVGKEIIATFSQQELNYFILQWMRNNDKWKIGKLWAKGVVIDWEQLYTESEKPKKIPLPTYPFIQTSYWYNESVLKDNGSNQVIKPTSFYINQEKPIEGFAALKTRAEQYDFVQYHLCKLINEVMGQNLVSFALEDTITSLGMDSLTWQSFRDRLKNQYNYELTMSSLLDGISISSIAEHLTELLQNNIDILKDHSNRVMTVTSDKEFDPFPLTEIQESFFVGRLLKDSNKSAGVGAQIYIEISESDISVQQLEAAWGKLIHYHGMLRAVMNADGTQQILSSVPLYDITMDDYSDLSLSQLAVALEKKRKRLIYRDYAIGVWPLFEISVSKAQTEPFFIIHFSICEMIADAESLMILLKQWHNLYDYPELQFEPLSLSFRDCVLYTHQMNTNDQCQRSLLYWTDLFKNQSIETRMPRTSQHDNAAPFRHRHVKVIDATIWSLLKQRAKTLMITPTSLLFTVFSEAILQNVSHDKFSLIVTYSGRRDIHPQIHDIIGPFLSTFLLIVEKSRACSLQEKMLSNQKQLWQALEHSDVSGIQVLRALKRSKVVDASLSLEVVFTSLLHSPQLKDSEWVRAMTHVNSRLLTPQIFFEHQCVELENKLYLIFDVAENYFLPGMIEQIIVIYCSVLEKLAFNEEIWINELIYSKNKEFSDNRKAFPVNLSNFEWQHSPAQRFESFSLSDMQSAYLFGRLLQGTQGNPSGQFYHELRLPSINISQLNTALNKVILRHDMLRGVVLEQGEQKIFKNVAKYAIAVNDLRDGFSENIEMAIQRERHRLINTVFPLGRWPFFEITATIIDDATTVLHFSFDFLIVDVFSFNIMLRDLFAYYHDPDEELMPLNFSFRDYLMSLQKYERTPEGLKSIQYWQEKFVNLPSGPPFALTHHATQTSVVTRRRLSKTIQNVKLLSEISTVMNIPLGIILLTVFTELLMANCQSRQAFTLVVVNWDRLAVHENINHVMGDFTRLSWLVCEPNSNLDSFEDKVRSIYQSWLYDKAHSVTSGLKELRKQMRKQGNKLSLPIVFTNIVPPLDIDMPKGSQLTGGLSQTSNVYLDAISEMFNDELHIHFDILDHVFPRHLVDELFNDYVTIIEALAQTGKYWKTFNLLDYVVTKPILQNESSVSSNH